MKSTSQIDSKFVTEPLRKLGCTWDKVRSEHTKFFRKITLTGVNKRPATDPSKGSKAGRVTTVRKDGSHGFHYEAARYPLQPEAVDAMQTVYENGEMLITHRFEDIRERAQLNRQDI